MTKLMDLATAGDHAAVIAAAANEPVEIVIEVADHLRDTDAYRVALQLYEAVLGRDDDADVQFGIGQCHGKMYDYAAALPCLRQAFEQDPNRDGASYFAYILERNDLLDEAGQWYRRAIQAGDEDLWTLSHHAWYLEKAGRPDEAEAAYRDVLQRNPAYTWAIKRLAMLLSSQDRHDEARQLLADASARLPDNPFVALNRLEYLLVQDELDEFERQRAALDAARHAVPVRVTLALFDVVATCLRTGQWDRDRVAAFEALTAELRESVHRDVDDLTERLRARGADVREWERLVGMLLR